MLCNNVTIYVKWPINFKHMSSACIITNFGYIYLVSPRVHNELLVSLYEFLLGLNTFQVFQPCGDIT